MSMPISQARHALVKNSLNFERTISKISSRFVMLTNDLDSAIQESLEDMGKSSGASRAYIFKFREDLNIMDNTHEWCSEGVIPEIDNLQELPSSIFPWWMSKLTQNEIILIPKVSDMPPEAAAEKEILENQDIQSLIVLPLFVSNTLYGFIGFDNTEKDNAWDTYDLTLLRLASEIFGNAFQRLASETLLRETNQQLLAYIDEIKKLQSQLINQEKMVGIGQLAAGVAHEINNPLGFVASNYEVLFKYIRHLTQVLEPVKQLIHDAETEFDYAHLYASLLDLKNVWHTNKIDYILEDAVELLEDSRIGFDRVSEIIGSLRNFAHTDLTDTMDFENIHDILDEVLLILNNEIKYVAEVERNYGNLPPILCHRGQLGQVFINLLVNAAHAIKSTKVHVLGHIAIKTWVDPSNENTYIEISDDGGGIPQEVLPSIFNPFFTTKPIGEGTGLGLSISYDIIVNKHKGVLSVESSPEVGSKFLIELPMR